MNPPILFPTASPMRPSPFLRSPSVRAAARIAVVRATACLTLLVALALAAPALQAQDSGLKLGEEPPEPTLDLGASPAEPPAAPAGSSEPGAGAAPEAADAEARRVTHGDWEVACAADGSGCAMAQIGDDATGTPVLEMVVRKLAEPLEVEEETAIAVLDVITPLGVVLTEGLLLQIDGGREEGAAFQICTEQGCLVREPIGSDLIERLKGGRVATLTVFAANQGEVKSEISLRGFTKAFAESP